MTSASRPVPFTRQGQTFDGPVTVGDDVPGAGPPRVAPAARVVDPSRPLAARGWVVVQVEQDRTAPAREQVVDLGVPALEQWCPGCAGSGSVHSAAWARWDEEHARLSVQAVDAWREPILQTIVSERLAELSARSPQEPRVLGCVRCAGLGVVPTAFGASVLDLVRRHLG
jgi:hypothetical protein